MDENRKKWFNWFVAFLCMFFRRLAFKVVIASTAVYWTNQLEVWSTLSSKERAYEQMIACAKAYICKNTPESLKLQVSIEKRTLDFKIASFEMVNKFHIISALRFSNRWKKFKTIKSCYALQWINTTIKVWWAHSMAFRIYQTQ